MSRKRTHITVIRYDKDGPVARFLSSKRRRSNLSREPGVSGFTSDPHNVKESDYIHKTPYLSPALSVTTAFETPSTLVLSTSGGAPPERTREPQKIDDMILALDAKICAYSDVIIIGSETVEDLERRSHDNKKKMEALTKDERRTQEELEVVKCYNQAVIEKHAKLLEAMTDLEGIQEASLQKADSIWRDTLWYLENS